jgi:hypothetical protein
MTLLQARLIQFALRTLDVLEGDRDWNSDTVDAISNGADFFKLSTTDDDGFFKSLVSEDDIEPVHFHPFAQGELITLLEAARMTLGDAELFDGIAESLDISDDELKRLQDKLNSHLNH